MPVSYTHLDVYKRQTLSASIPAVEAAKYIGFLQFVPKVLRGNHYHFRKVEYMLILQGRMQATFQKYDDSEAVIEEIWEKGGASRYTTAIQASTRHGQIR